jgi:hypothetical protein
MALPALPQGAWGKAQPGPAAVPDPFRTSLTGYGSPNEKAVDDAPAGPAALAELERIRGITERDSVVHKAIS